MAEEAIRSSSLHEIVSWDGNIQRIDYVNEQGEITFAADKQYATEIITYDGTSQTIEYFDASGNPVRHKQGYYAVYRQIDEFGRVWKLTFWGIDKQPVLCGNGYASYIRTFYDNGNVKTEYYYDKQGNPIKTNSFGYGCFKEYDESNRNTVLVYLGEDDNPIITAQGFAIVRRTYYEDGVFEGSVKEEYYYDTDENPVVLTHGQSGCHIEYDQYGRGTLFTYLDADGNPIITKEGYTTVKRTYYEDDTIESEMYFDKNGDPVSLSEGQYGIRYKDGKQIFLDASGREQINVKRLLYNNEWVVVFAAAAVILLSLIVGRKANILLFALYIVAILYMTLMYRTEIPPENYSFLSSLNRRRFLYSFLSKGMINNILLFIPLGTILYQIYPKKVVFLIPVVISLAIELSQYFLRIGYCELNDLLGNSFGGLLGYAAGSILTKVTAKMKAKGIKK